MSKESARAFLKRVSEDENMQEKILAFAAQEGFQFTTEELSELELGEAAGGIGLLLPAVQKVRASASRMESTNNLKQLG